MHCIDKSTVGQKTLGGDELQEDSPLSVPIALACEANMCE